MARAIIIGGSAGSFQVITQILSKVKPNYRLPIILCLHRLKHVRSGFVEALAIKSTLPIVEPYDKEKVEKGNIYLAPANYHLFTEVGYTFSLSIDKPVNHSRPAIDLSFYSTANVYRNHLVGIILSGANKDGALGLKRVKDLGGITIVQDPNEAQVKTMPTSAKNVTEVDFTYTTQQIIDYINKLG